MGFNLNTPGMELRANPADIAEVNFQRLLSQTKSLLQGSQVEQNHWRCVKYVEKLEELLKTLEKNNSKKLSIDTLTTYKGEVKFLKELLNTVGKADSSESLLLSQRLVIPVGISQTSTSTESYSSTTSSLSDLKNRAVSLYAKDLRKQLLGAENDSGDIGLKLRSVKTPQTHPFDNDFDAVISHHNKLQEKLADDFITLTQNLKANVTLAGQVVTDDNRKLEKITAVAEANKLQLDKESKRLEKHAYNSCDCWIYICLLAVCISFVGMVMFIRFFPKK